MKMEQVKNMEELIQLIIYSVFEFRGFALVYTRVSGDKNEEKRYISSLKDFTHEQFVHKFNYLFDCTTSKCYIIKIIYQ